MTEREKFLLKVMIFLFVIIGLIFLISNYWDQLGSMEIKTMKLKSEQRTLLTAVHADNKLSSFLLDDFSLFFWPKDRMNSLLLGQNIENWLNDYGLVPTQLKVLKEDAYGATWAAVFSGTPENTFAFLEKLRDQEFTFSITALELTYNEGLLKTYLEVSYVQQP